MTRLRRRGVLIGGGTLLALAVPGLWAVPTARAETRLRVDYQPPMLTVEGERVGVAEVLRAIGAHVGFSIVEAGSAPEPLSLSVRGPTETVLRHVLVRTSYALVYRNRAGAPHPADIETIIVLGPGSTGGDLTAPRLPDGAERKAAKPSGVTPEAARIDVEPESASGAPHTTPTVSDLLREQATAMIPGPPIPEPVGDVVSPESKPTPPNVATTILRAQHGVQALVDALHSLTGALMKSAPSLRRER